MTTPLDLDELLREIYSYLAFMDEANSLAPHRLAAIQAYSTLDDDRAKKKPLYRIFYLDDGELSETWTHQPPPPRLV